MIRSVFALLALLPAAAFAETPRLAFPVDCVPGDTCHIQQLMDRDLGPGATDFACGTLSYDGHKGTDIALPHLRAQAAGVAVRAAASGVVRGIRDGMADILQGTPGAPDLEGRECGNGVVVAMGDGWEAQYCHMRQGSIAVRPGDTVATGERLGEIGLSGATQFPHLHLSIRKDGAPVDPFDVEGGACGTDTRVSLWQIEPPTPQGGFISLGFAEEVPDYAEIREGTAGLGSRVADPSALVVWADMFWPRDGDVLKITIDGPGGYTDGTEIAIDRTQAQAFRAWGRRTPQGGTAWPSGPYTATVLLTRDGAVIDEATTSLSVD